jgi:hypothetical protein
MKDECFELKTIKYKSMLLSNSTDEPLETVENLSNMNDFLEVEKNSISSDPWTKLNKTTKLLKFNEFVLAYCNEHKYPDSDKIELTKLLSTNLDRKRLLKSKEVLYDKVTGKITSIPSLIYNNTTKKFTLKRCEKRQSTLKSLAPKRIKSAKTADEGMATSELTNSTIA